MCQKDYSEFVRNEVLEAAQWAEPYLRKLFGDALTFEDDKLSQGSESE